MDPAVDLLKFKQSGLVIRFDQCADFFPYVTPSKEERGVGWSERFSSIVKLRQGAPPGLEGFFRHHGVGQRFAGDGLSNRGEKRFFSLRDCDHLLAISGEDGWGDRSTIFGKVEKKVPVGFKYGLGLEIGMSNLEEISLTVRCEAVDDIDTLVDEL